MGALDGKVALVTGGSRGIGRGIAERLGRDGALVALTYAQASKEADEVVERIRANGGEAFAIQAEFGQRGDAARLWEAFDAQTPRPGVDIVVNNAARGSNQDLASVTEEEFDKVFAVNVRTPFFIIQEAVERMRDGGRIINISSGATRLAMPNIIAYAPTKSAVDNLTLHLAKLLGPRGITANSVAPGFVDTDMNADWLRNDEEAWARSAAISALGRVGEPRDIADIVAFLASDDARWITGQVIDATGGSLI
ncbi:SDR family oxidoreductase [Actinomadura litoris]|uniref:SDR family oxidoreductase n=1 Tax=Actinomadura litoris TaxID=2678616 RepID=UPI001FA7BCD7|nr:SDR family oxidoreductase [Actinomadura litoris]